MEDKQNKKDLGVSQLASKSLAYELAKAKESKNLLGDIRKETRSISSVLKSWKIEDISKLQLKLDRDADRFAKLKERTGKKKEKKKSTDSGIDLTKLRKLKEEPKPKEEPKSTREKVERGSKFEQERAARTRQLREKGLPLDEARKRAFEDTRRAQKYRPLGEVPKEIPKGVKPGEGFFSFKNIKSVLNPKNIAGGAATLGIQFLLDMGLQAVSDKYSEYQGEELSKKIQSLPEDKKQKAIQNIQKTISQEKEWQSSPLGMVSEFIGGISGETVSQKKVKVATSALSKLQKPPKMAEGGIVTKPTMAIIGEGGEKEYIVPQSKLQDFIGAQSSGGNDSVRKPARVILGVVNNFISQFGTGSGDIRRMVGGDILRLERIYGRERFVLPVFTKGEGNFENIIGDTFKDLVKGRKVGGALSQELYDSIGNLFVSIDQFMSDLQMIGGTTSGAEGGVAGDGEIVAEELPPEAKALLDAIAGSEAGAAGYKSRFPSKSFDSFADHPRVDEPIPWRPGYTSNAAGRYQFLSTTWDGLKRKLGLTDFSPANQDRAAWQLAVDTYGKGVSGIISDLKENPLKVANALSGQWTSLPGGSEKNSQTDGFVRRFKTNVERYQSRGTSTPSTQQSVETPSTATAQLSTRPRNGEFVFEPTPGFNIKYKIKVSNGKIISGQEIGKSVPSIDPKLLQPAWDSGDGKVFSTSGATQQTQRVLPQSALPPLPRTNTLAGQEYGAMREGGARKHAGQDFDISGNEKFYSRIGGVVVGNPFRYGADGWAIDIYNRNLGVYERIAEAARILVRPNQAVAPGEAVVQGESGTGVIHYEIRKKIEGGYENTVNPLEFLRNMGDVSFSPGTDSSSAASQLTPGSSGITPALSSRIRRVRQSIQRAFQQNPRLGRNVRQRTISSLPGTQNGNQNIVAVQPIVTQVPSPQPQQQSQNIASAQRSTRVTGFTPIVFNLPVA